MSLFDAVRAGDVARVRALIAEGAFIDDPGEGGRTPLIEAAAMGHLELVKLLLAAKADVHWKDDERETALLKAAAQGHHAVVNLLSPLAPEEERDMARAFLKHHGMPATALPPREPKPGEDEPSAAHYAAKLALRAGAFFGDEKSARQLERLERAEKLKKK